MSFMIYSSKNVETKMFLQIYKILSNFDKNTPNIAKTNCVFRGKGRRDGALILTYLDSPMAEAFPNYCLSFSISAIFRRKRVVKVGSKVQTFGSSLVHENSNPSNF